MYNRLPTYVKIDGERYFINTDYRLFIEFEKDMQDKDAKEVIVKTLSNFYPAFSKIVEKKLLKEAIDKFTWFYLCGENKKEEKKRSGKKGTQTRIYDYDVDAQLIWGAYWDRGIDLTVDKVHWWKFKALFKTMPDNCEFKKIIGYRCYDGKDKDKLELKEIYKLPPTKFEVDERKRQDDIYNQLKEMSSHK